MRVLRYVKHILVGRSSELVAAATWELVDVVTEAGLFVLRWQGAEVQLRAEVDIQNRLIAPEWGFG